MVSCIILVCFVSKEQGQENINDHNHIPSCHHQDRGNEQNYVCKNQPKPGGISVINEPCKVQRSHDSWQDTQSDHKSNILSTSRISEIIVRIVYLLPGNHQVSFNPDVNIEHRKKEDENHAYLEREAKAASDIISSCWSHGKPNWVRIWWKLILRGWAFLHTHLLLPQKRGHLILSVYSLGWSKSHSWVWAITDVSGLNVAQRVVKWILVLIRLLKHWWLVLIHLISLSLVLFICLVLHRLKLSNDLLAFSLPFHHFSVWVIVDSIQLF